MAMVGPHQNDDWLHCQEALTYREEPRVYECLCGCGTSQKLTRAPPSALDHKQREFRCDLVGSAHRGHLRVVLGREATDGAAVHNVDAEHPHKGAEVKQPAQRNAAGVAPLAFSHLRRRVREKGCGSRGQRGPGCEGGDLNDVVCAPRA